jgi:hypothetical protein
VISAEAAVQAAAPPHHLDTFRLDLTWADGIGDPALRRDADFFCFLTFC